MPYSNFMLLFLVQNLILLPIMRLYVGFINLKEPKGHLACWALKLQAYDYRILHCPGNKHQNVNGLSRLPAVHVLNQESEDLFSYLVDQVKVHKNPDLQKIIDYLRVNKVVKDGKLYKIVNSSCKIHPFTSERSSLISSAHSFAGYSGIYCNLSHLQTEYYCECMSAEVYDVTSACHEHQIHRPYKRRSQYNLVKPGYAWNTISIDVVGPLPLSIGKAKYIIVAIDGLTKWVEARAISNLSSSTAAKFIIDQVIVRHGCPHFIKTDNNTKIASGSFKNS